MQITSPPSSAWQQLKRGHINCEQALNLLKNEQGGLNIERLDKEVSTRFFQAFPDQKITAGCAPVALAELLLSGQSGSLDGGGGADAARSHPHRDSNYSHHRPMLSDLAS